MGERWAYRKAARGQPLRPVEIVRLGPPRTQKAKVRWLDGDLEGLEEWVHRGYLLVVWEEAEALLEDEHRMLAASAASGNVVGTARYRAVEMVFFAAPVQSDIFFGAGWHNRDLLVLDDLDSSTIETGLSREQLLAEPHAFIDRHGSYVAPFQTAERVAREVCRRFTDVVVTYVERQEEEYHRKMIMGPHPGVGPWPPSGKRGEVERMWAEEKPIFDLVREWCGQDASAELRRVPALQEEINRLHRLLEVTADWLHGQGHRGKAAALRRELKAVDLFGPQSAPGSDGATQQQAPDPHPRPKQRLVPVSEAAKMLGISCDHLRAMIRDGRIMAVRNLGPRATRLSDTVLREIMDRAAVEQISPRELILKEARARSRRGRI